MVGACGSRGGDRRAAAPGRVSGLRALVLLLLVCIACAVVIVVAIYWFLISRGAIRALAAVVAVIQLPLLQSS